MFAVWGFRARAWGLEFRGVPVQNFGSGMAFVYGKLLPVFWAVQALGVVDSGLWLWDVLFRC